MSLPINVSRLITVRTDINSLTIVRMVANVCRNDISAVTTRVLNGTYILCVIPRHDQIPYSYSDNHERRPDKCVRWRAVDLRQP